MTSERAIASGALALLLVGLLGCADFERGAPSDPGSGGMPPGDGDGDGDGDDAGDGDGDGDGDAVDFSTDVYPLLTGDCMSCHRDGGEAGGTDLILTGVPEDDYTNVRDLVIPGDAAGSRLLAKGAGTGHTPGAVWAGEDLQTVGSWIDSGAEP